MNQKSGLYGKSANRSIVAFAALATAVLLALVMSGCTASGANGSSGSDSGKANKSEQTENQQANDQNGSQNADNQDASQQFDFNDLVGMTVPDAQTEIQQQGYSATWDMRDEDGGKLVDPSDNPSSITAQGFEQDWIVVEVTGIDKNKKTVTVYIDKATHASNKVKDKQTLEALQEKLPKSDAWNAVKNYGKQQYPNGFDLHNILNEISAEPLDENTWSLKTTCDIKDASGVKRKDLTLEAKVTGTKSDPQVTDFQVY